MKIFSKKLLGFLLTVIMVCSMAMTVFADGALNGGSITIVNPTKGQTYHAYQILYLESYDADAGAYAYKASAEWKSWLETQTSYVSMDPSGYVTWKTGADVAEFVKAAQGQLAGKTVAGSVTAADGAAVIDNLQLGYYLVDSSVGSICSLDTTNPNAEITDKNEKPVMDKLVQEDSTADWGERNDADMSQTVPFKSTVTAQAGAKNYVFHDKMDAGLTFTSVKEVQLNGATVDAENYEVIAKEACTDGCSFHINFTDAFCNSLEKNDEIVILYEATLNGDAVVAGDGNLNEAWLVYGAKNETTHETTTTYTWECNILKYTGSGNKEKVLPGAKFVLYKVIDGIEQYATVSDGKLTGWGTDKAGATELVSDTNGKIMVKGLDADTYYLEETQAPTGYNKLAEPVMFLIDHAGNVKDSNEVDAPVLENKTVKVENNTGAELPSTGGIGTTVFYLLGGILTVSAVVLLVAKRRMRAQ